MVLELSPISELRGSILSSDRSSRTTGCDLGVGSQRLLPAGLAMVHSARNSTQNPLYHLYIQLTKQLISLGGLTTDDCRKLVYDLQTMTPEQRVKTIYDKTGPLCLESIQPTLDKLERLENQLKNL